MKKKLLSLVLAGAMVATTSVSAFAATDTTKEVTVDRNNGTETRIDVTGNMESTTGETVQGTISVTVPTAVAFTVDRNGDITGGDIQIVNKGGEKDKVEVVVKEFKDPNPTSGIVLVKEGDLDTKIGENSADKRHISLKLTGSGGSVGLVSSKDDSQTGLVDAQGQSISTTANTSLGNAWNGNDLTLTLTGKTKKTTGEAYVAPNKAIQSNFNLILKIQKAR